MMVIDACLRPSVLDRYGGCEQDGESGHDRWRGQQTRIRAMERVCEGEGEGDGPGGGVEGAFAQWSLSSRTR